MSDAKKRERYLPASLLTVLYMPVMAAVFPLAAGLSQSIDSLWPLGIVPLAIVAAYWWAIPRTRRF